MCNRRGERGQVTRFANPLQTTFSLHSLTVCYRSLSVICRALHPSLSNSLRFPCSLVYSDPYPSCFHVFEACDHWHRFRSSFSASLHFPHSLACRLSLSPALSSFPYSTHKNCTSCHTETQTEEGGGKGSFVRGKRGWKTPEKATFRPLKSHRKSKSEMAILLTFSHLYPHSTQYGHKAAFFKQT